MRRVLTMGALAMVAASAVYSIQAQAANQIDCKMRFNLTGWAAIYKHAEGHGTITCSNGRSFHVNIVTVGGGLTAGKFKMRNGTGRFSSVYDTDELFGSYAQEKPMPAW